MLLRAGNRTRTLEGIAPAEFYPGPAPIEVRVPKDELQQAIEALTKEAGTGR